MKRVVGELWFVVVWIYVWALAVGKMTTVIQNLFCGERMMFGALKSINAIIARWVWISHLFLFRFFKQWRRKGFFLIFHLPRCPSHISQVQVDICVTLSRFNATEFKHPHLLLGLNCGSHLTRSLLSHG